MKTRKIALLSAIACLACAWALQLTLGGGDSVKLVKLTERQKPDSVTIARGDGKSVALAKDGDKWAIGEKKYTADQAKVTDLLSALETVKVLGTVSRSGDLERYGLAETQRVTVTASMGGKALRAIAIGKAAATSQQSYAILDGGKDVVLVSGNLKDTFGVDADSLRDKTVWSVPPESVTRIESHDASGKISFALAKTGNPAVWSGAEPEKVRLFSFDAAKVDSWAASFAKLAADSFASEGTTVPDATLASFVVTGGGKTITLALRAKEGENRYLCTSAETPYPFYLSSAVVSNMQKAYTEFAAASAEKK
jgi:hypothetical protein